MVPLSLMGIHFVGLPTAGAFVSVPADDPAPLVKVVLLVSNVDDPMLIDPFTSSAALLRGLFVPMPTLP